MSFSYSISYELGNMRALVHLTDWQRYKANLLILLPFSQSWHWRGHDRCKLFILSIHVLSNAFWSQLWSSIWHTQASVSCSEGGPWVANWSKIRFLCAFNTHSWHFDGKAWLTVARSVPFSNESHEFRWRLRHSMENNEDLTCRVTESVIVKANHRSRR